MQIIDGKALLFKPETPAITAGVLKKYHVLPDGHVLAHWNQHNAETLAMFGYQPPSPIARKYHYPGRDTVMDQQRRMAEFMTLHHRCFNFSDMGTGKTRASLWAADYLMNCGLVKRVLIIATLSVLKTAWEADLFATVMHRSYGIAIGDAKRRKKIIESGCEFVIINHDGIKHSRLELVRAGFDLIIVDEATAFANTQTDRWKALNSMVKPETRVWMLTGTPAANSPLQAYGLAKIVNPSGVPRFFSGWKDLTMIKVSNFTYIPKLDAQQTVYNALQPAIRIDKKDCLDLPPVTFVEREIPMEPQQAKYYNAMKHQMLVHVAGKQITSVNSGVLMGKLLQIASGAVYSDDGNIIDFRAEARLKEVLQVVQENEHKVLIFANYKHTLRLIGEFLDKHGIENARIDGDTTPDARALLINMFQNTDTLKVLVLQPKVASHGITLTRANVAVWFSPTSSLETWRQANDRINRIGQVNKMTVVKLVGAPVERKVYTILEKRDAVQTDLLDLYRTELESE